MKKLLKSYTSFSRAERMGMLALGVVLFILIIIRATMYMWVHPSINEEQQKKLMSEWDNFKRTHTTSEATNSNEGVKKEHQDASDTNTELLADIINLNTTDSTTLVRLKGIGPVTASKIMERRKVKGPFENVDQLTEVGSFNSVTLDILKRHLTIK